MGISEARWLGGVYEFTYAYLNNRPGLVFTPFDRPEMIFATLAAFYQNIPVAQVHAGDKSKGTWDDTTRHSISLYATLHFCNGEKSKRRVERLLKSIGKENTRVFDVGSTAFDGIELDESIVPRQPYNLVLYNVPSSNP